jgi:tetratricopeptide (TPR) repeat protein
MPMTTEFLLSPSSPVETTHKAHTSLQASDPAEMLNEMDHVRSVSQQYPSYHIVRGECLIALGRTTEARAALKLALKLSPNSARPALLLESLYESSDTLEPIGVQTASLTRPLKKAATLAALFGDASDEPRHRPRVASINHERRSNFNLGEIASLLTRERPLVRPNAESMHLEEPVLYQDSGSPVISETLAGILLGQGKLQEALDAYRHLLSLDRDNAEYYQERIQIIQARIRP